MSEQFRDKAAALQEAAKERDLEETRDWVFRRISSLKKDAFGMDDTDPNVGYLVTSAGRLVRVTVGPVDGGE